MVMTQDIRGRLAERVERKLAGRRIGRAAIDAAVGRVVTALATAPATPNTSLVMALSAAGLPDLASRVSAALAGAGIAPIQIAHAHAGRHTVVTLCVDESRRSDIERIASELGARASAVPGEDIA